jgi:hypothetical protein
VQLQLVPLVTLAWVLCCQVADMPNCKLHAVYR